MAFYYDKKTGNAENPVFLSILEHLTGGVLVKVDSRVPDGLHTLYAGTPIATNSTTGEYMFMKSAILATAKASGATKITVERPHPFKVGEFIWIEGTAAATAATLTAVGTNYLVTAVTTYGAAKKAVVTQANAANATAPKFRPFALLGHSVKVRNADGSTCYNVFADAVVRGTAVISNFVFGISADVQGRLGDRMRFVNKGQK